MHCGVLLVGRQSRCERCDGGGASSGGRTTIATQYKRSICTNSIIIIGSNERSVANGASIAWFDRVVASVVWWHGSRGTTTRSDGTKSRQFGSFELESAAATATATAAATSRQPQQRLKKKVKERR
jgi:hypothetical protein